MRLQGESGEHDHRTPHSDCAVCGWRAARQAEAERDEHWARLQWAAEEIKRLRAGADPPPAPVMCNDALIDHEARLFPDV